MKAAINTLSLSLLFSFFLLLMVTLLSLLSFLCFLSLVHSNVLCSSSNVSKDQNFSLCIETNLAHRKRIFPYCLSFLLPCENLGELSSPSSFFYTLFKTFIFSSFLLSTTTNDDLNERKFRVCACVCSFFFLSSFFYFLTFLCSS